MNLVDPINIVDASKFPLLIQRLVLTDDGKASPRQDGQDRMVCYSIKDIPLQEPFFILETNTKETKFFWQLDQENLLQSNSARPWEQNPCAISRVSGSPITLEKSASTETILQHGFGLTLPTLRREIALDGITVVEWSDDTISIRIDQIHKVLSKESAQALKLWLLGKK